MLFIVKRATMKKYVSLLMSLVLCISLFNTQVNAITSTADHIIISQVYGGGGNSGAPYYNDFIELYNPTNSTVDLNNWSVQYASYKGVFSDKDYALTPLTGTIGPGEYYLIQEANGKNDSAALPTPNLIGSITLSSSSGTVALVSDHTVVSAVDDSNVVDFVGYGTAKKFEGSGAAPKLSNTTSASRIHVGVDTDNNANDFESTTPNPRSSSQSGETESTCATPKADIPSGKVAFGQKITFSCDTPGAEIAYTTTTTGSIQWTEEKSITVTTDAAYYVRATKDGLKDSEMAVFSYSVDKSKYISVEEAKAIASDTDNVKVKGIISYISKKNVYIQDSTGAICLYLTSNAVNLNVGDEIIASGTRKDYYNLIEITGVEESAISVVSSDNDIPDRGTTTIAKLIEKPEGKTNGYDHMCEVINLQNATLTSTSKLSQDGSDLTLYPTVDLSDYSGVSIGDSVNVTLRFYDYKGTLEGSIISMTNAEAAMSIKDVLALSQNTEDVTVSGQLAYFATSYSNPVIQSVIDGKLYSLYVFGSAPDGAKIGDIIKLNGTYSIYNGLPEMTSVKSCEIIGSETPMDASPMTIADIKANGLTMLGRFVKLSDVTLGAYKASGSTVVSDSTGSINIYKAPEYPTLVEAGDVVDLYAMIACYNSSIQLYVGTKEANGFNVYSVVNDTKEPIVTLDDQYLDAKTGFDYTISVAAEDNKDIQSVMLSYTIGDQTISDKAMVKNTTTGKYEYIIPGSEILSSAESFTFTVTAEDVSGLKTTTKARTVHIDNRPHIVEVKPDKNSSTGADKAPLISVLLENAGIDPKVTLTLKKANTAILTDQPMVKVENTTAAAFSYTTSTLEDGDYTATVNVLRSDNISNSVTWLFTVGTSKYKAYFGQLHAHTAQYSDGSGTLQNGLDYLSAIPEKDNVDFVSFTDHSNYFDKTSAANPAEALNDKTQMTEDSLKLWESYKGATETYNKEHAGSTLALSGFEMTWSGGPGHINTFNSDGLVSRNNETLNSKTDDSGMKAYYETLIQNTDPLANLSQFNHPGKTFGTFSDFAYWSPAYDNKMVSVEVGNGEGAIESGGYFQSYSEYTKALDKGWHVAPTNNQDNHKGHWGNANTCRTVIITDNFTSEGLLTGMKNMSVYATEDKNLNIDYTLNDHLLGSIIDTVPDSPLRFSVNIDDEDSTDMISKVEIITNGGHVAAAKNFDTNVVNWSFELPSTQGYYYVRVTEADKDMAVTAPVWIGQAPLIGISSVQSGTKMPVTDESLTVNTTLFNNETSPVTINSVEYAIGDKVISTETLNQELASNETKLLTFDYTPSIAGTIILSVKVGATIEGQQKTYSQNLTLHVRDKEKLIYIGIDASHYNEYVNGNYKDSMGNLANLAVDYNIRVVELSTSEDLIAATKNPKYSMLILTPPTRRDGNYFLKDYKNYSDEEIKAIADFSALGKTLIITGWGDYYENYTAYSDKTPYTLPKSDHMAAQQNKLLAALGSSLRISDDEIKDDQKNGGQPQRLYLTNYNMDNDYLIGVNPNEQVYSNYGGSTLYAVNQEGTASKDLASSIDPLVYSFTSGYSVDEDKDGTTNTDGILVPKYDNKYLVAASETLTHKDGTSSSLIVAGSAFMSNFEIQATLDSYSTPEYSNYTLLQNILKVTNTNMFTSIENVKKGISGETFIIRGIATSNASGETNKDVAFNDCIYIQDNTGGINVFPVTGNIKAGQTLEIKGTLSSYNGEIQLSAEQVTVLDDTIQPLPDPIVLTTKQAAESDYLGSLVKVTGSVVSYTAPNDVVESIYIEDASGVSCRVFIDGYITSNKTIMNLVAGSTLTAVGLSSIDTEGSRIRIRDRDDIVCVLQTNHDSSSDKKTKEDNKDKVDTVSDNNRSTVSGEINPVTDSSNGHIKGEVSKDLADKLIDLAKTAEEEGKNAVIEIKMNPNTSNGMLEIALVKDSLNSIATETKSDLKINTGLGIIEFDSTAVSAINEASTEDISIGIEKVDPDSLTDELKKVINNRPVYDFTIQSGNKIISDFNKGKARINLPYTLKEGEDPNAIVVYYINDQGELQTMRGNYNAETGMVAFITDHFSTYMIGYNGKKFTDISKDDWYYDAVTFLAARDILYDLGHSTFNPQASLTRGQFIAMLMRAYNLEANPTSTNFSDAGDSQYTPYLSTAKALGIAKGIGHNQFLPDEAISRQDMLTLVYRTLSIIDELSESTDSEDLSKYGDLNEISDYAKESFTFFIKGGFIKGSNNQLHPTDFTTRADMAQFLYRLLNMDK